MRAYERLLKYAKVYTTSDPESGTHPSAARAFVILIIILFQYTIFRLSAHQESKNFISGIPYSFSIYLRGKICYTGM